MNLYLHIPFCASRCSYCDFYTQVGGRWRRDFLTALLGELRLRRDELPEGEHIEHIYLGGGTPSLLTIEELRLIFSLISELYASSYEGEITIECNPDDVTEAYAEGLASLPINRVSMGVQSFDADDLTFLNRRHSAQQVHSAIRALRQCGITNLSLDLIYGLPRQTEAKWRANIKEFLSLGVPHLSAYHLIYEEGTALTRLVERGKVKPVDEEASLLFFQILIDELRAAGYEHYEISNFALPGLHARHNTGYWQGVPYLGFGPSAHSFDGRRTRSYNVPSLKTYTTELLSGRRPYEEEHLSDEELQHEYVMTRLRTQWGISLEEYQELFGGKAPEALLHDARPHLEAGKLTDQSGVLRLTPSGVFISDGIIADLFV
ncbi:putative oxygen-independent coproporphyrinogen III oxidase [Porphyromonas sp. oral taxon 278 str. W7784]|uniref:radical SAM family heme chaperone HemW n=1 Tax=Porphyromonas sp. oral taxon 278 TaxID=712437 RepID=UPI0003ACF4F6|nr:radical SAM family heme chaperone HemW [Porphyromonas sp. oral taxon 278]ERJ70020.1 putative oxygen-independent coproporphyrinogen III oxidase [Porphyromonas sp. oral taxon 278 str. W7784]